MISSHESLFFAFNHLWNIETLFQVFFLLDEFLFKTQLLTNQTLTDEPEKKNLKKDKKNSAQVSMLNLQSDHETIITVYKRIWIKQ
jgi:hypothetical protein